MLNFLSDFLTFSYVTLIYKIDKRKSLRKVNKNLMRNESKKLKLKGLNGANAKTKKYKMAYRRETKMRNKRFEKKVRAPCAHGKWFRKARAGAPVHLARNDGKKVLPMCYGCYTSSLLQPGNPAS